MKDILFKVLMLKGDAGEPTDEQTQSAVNEYMQAHPEAAIDETIINSAVDDWLDDHPEATTTVLDGSLTEPKFSDALKLKTIKDYVTPEMFGYTAGDDLGALINQMLAAGYYNIRLLGKEYTLKTPINIKDIVGGCIEGVCPISTETFSVGNNANIGTITYINTSDMNGNAAILIHGCLNFNLKNFLIRSNAEADTPSVGIYMGRTADHQSSQWNDISGVGVYLPHSATLNGGKGTIGIYNNAAEEFTVEKSSVVADVGIVNTDRDCYSLASSLGGENITGATCTVIRYEKLAIGAGIGFVNSYTAGIRILDVFMFDKYKQTTNTILMKADFTNSPAQYWADYIVDIYAEQLKMPFYIKSDGFIKILYSVFTMTTDTIASEQPSDGVLDLANDYVLLGNTFDLKDATESANVIAKLTSGTSTIRRCIFKGKPVQVASIQAFGVANGNGAFGFSKSNDVEFGFAVNNNRCIGSSWSIPTSVTDVGNGSICMCTDPSSTVALWVYKNGTWVPVSTN